MSSAAAEESQSHLAPLCENTSSVLCVNCFVGSVLRRTTDDGREHLASASDFHKTGKSNPPVDSGCSNDDGDLDDGWASREGWTAR